MEMFAIILLLLLSSILSAQTGGVNVVGGNVDLSGVNTAIKIKSYTVSTLPTNTAGVLAYVTDGTSNTDCSVGGGSTKVLCLADGTNWNTPPSGGSPSVPPPPASSTIGDFWVVRTSPTVLTIGQNCTTAFPCRVAFGTTTFQITAPATATISAGSATAYIYISDTQVLSVGTNGDTVVCSGCTTVGSISAFPPTAIPLWNWTASSGAWTLSGGTDQRTIVQKGADPLASYLLTSSDTQLKNATVVVTQSVGDNSTKVATTAFVTTAINNAIAGVNPAVAVLAASTTSIVGTYTPVAGGIGDTFTVTATGAFTLDGIAINTIGQRVLLKNQGTAFQNGVYTATVIGVSLVSPVFTRALDFDQPSDINNTGAIPVVSGTVNATTLWVVTSTVNNVGSDAITFTQFGGSATGVTSASTIGANLPVFGSDGVRGVAAGTVTGNTTKVVTGTGSYTSGNLLKSDANGNAIDAGIASPGTGPLAPFYYGPTLIPLDSSSNWTSINLTGGGSTATATRIQTNQAEDLYYPNIGTTQWKGRVENIPGTPYTITATLQCQIKMQVNTILCGMYLYDGTKLYGIDIISQVNTTQYELRKFTSVTDGSSTTQGSVNDAPEPQGRVYVFRIKDDATNRTWSWSDDDGNTFQTLATEASNTFLTPTKVGYGGVSVVAGTAPFAMHIRLVSWLVTTP